MFKVGDYIIYGSNGVCRVTDIGDLESMGMTKGRIYYTLEPYHVSGNKIFTPVDNDKVMIRPVIGREEAMRLIDDMKDIESLLIPDEKQREVKYKDAIRKCDCRELVKIIKTIYLRKQSRLAEGKKVTASDEKYFRIAEENLYGELAVSLDMAEEDARAFVINRIEQLEEQYV